MVYMWLFLGKEAPVTLAVCVYSACWQKMCEDLFLLKIHSNWAVSLHASKTFSGQQLAQKFLLGFPQGCGLSVSSLVWGFPAPGNAPIFSDVLCFVGLCFGCCSTNGNLSAP